LLRCSLAALLSAVLLGGLASAAAAQPGQPSPSPPVVVDGPDADIQSLNGLSVARDGTGGLVYLKLAGGVPHVFVSALVGGAFQAPAEVDAALPAGSSQPVIAAGNGGVLLIGFINAGELYEVQRASTTAGFTSPVGLAVTASDPSLQMSNLGKAYMAFTVADGGGHDVRAAYWVAGNWSVESAPLNAVSAGDDAGTGAGAPAVATAGDGVAIVARGEGGHIYTRRVWATAPSVVSEQADPAFVGSCGEVSVGDPSVSAGGDSSYADVAFREVVSCSGGPQARVVVNRLRGSQYDGAVAADGLSSGGESAGDPDVVMGEYGAGWVTSEGATSNASFAMQLGNNGTYGNAGQIDSLEGTTPPDPVPATAGLFSTFIAWQQDPGASGPAEIRVRYQPRNSPLGPETVVSSPSQGPTNAALGLAADGDVGGDAAIAWVQGTTTSKQIVAERLYQPPGAATPAKALTYSRSAQPVLSWSASGARWGPITYTVSVDGVGVGQTGGDSLRVPNPLSNGPHGWGVTATNPAGLTSASNPARVFVDTVAPRLSATVAGARRAGASLTLRLTYRDAPPAGLPAADASGVASLTIRWGDGTSTRIKPGTHRLIHIYARPGRDRITVIVADRAGNQTRVVRAVKITGAPGRGKPKK
jgi:hypothetical protein